MLKEKEKEEKEPEVSEIDAVSEFSKHFKRVMKERANEESNHELTSMAPVKEEDKEVEEEEEQKEEEEEKDDQNISVGLGGILSMLRSQNANDMEEEAYGRRTDRMIRDDANDGEN